MVLSVLLILLGVFMICKPSIIWTLTESWKSNDATEPSKVYIVSTRFGGAMLSLAGIAGIVALNL
ncbi:hypothetical protein GCM10023310_09570 [Paenibacillus vulneris]|uniref:DUF6199 family natural product biosynthesis protein n=1 Tax=Paenibacillus vulneris TaxID=1133364 RepID=A0ABW3UVV9_9BACL|nr:MULTISPECIES: DUF6199 family natural product biosynthesis protein [unclassified Paenibacillus]MBE1443666.1 hypothetical protein [Paenibacillus sp. OAS669]